MSFSALQHGGPATVPLVLLSIVVVAIGVDRIRYWRQQGLNPERIQRRLIESLDQGQDSSARSLRQELFLQQLESSGSSGEAVLEAATVIGPLLGLIGTVSGLIKALAALGPQLILPNGGSSLDSYGQVLVSTALGLVVALIATVVLRTNQGLRQWQRQQLETTALRYELEGKP